MNPHRQHHTPAPRPMHPLLILLIDSLCAASLGIAIALAVTAWSLT